MPMTWEIPLGAKTRYVSYSNNHHHPSPAPFATLQTHNIHPSSSPPVFFLKPHLSWSERKALIICRDWDVNPCAPDPSLYILYPTASLSHWGKWLTGLSPLHFTGLSFFLHSLSLPMSLHIPSGKERISYWEATKATASARLAPNHVALLSESLLIFLIFWLSLSSAFTRDLPVCLEQVNGWSYHKDE